MISVIRHEWNFEQNRRVTAWCLNVQNLCESVFFFGSDICTYYPWIQFLFRYRLEILLDIEKRDEPEIYVVGEIGVSILETCWRAHITIVTLCHPFVVYHTYMYNMMRGDKNNSDFISRSQRSWRRKWTYLSPIYTTIMGQIIRFFLSNHNIYKRLCGLWFKGRGHLINSF